MAGLLGDTWGDPQTQAALSMAAGLLGGGNFGQALGRGLGGYQQSMAAANEAKLRQATADMAKEELGWKREDMAQSQAQLAARQQAMGQLSKALQSGTVSAQELLKLGLPIDLIKEVGSVLPKPETKVVGNALVQVDPSGSAKELYSADAKIDPNKPFMLKDGQIVPNAAYQQFELDKAQRGAARTNVSTVVDAAPKAFWQDFGKNASDTLFKEREGAQAAASTLQSVGEIRKAAEGGAFQGAGAELKLGAAKALQGLGMPYDAKTVANSELFNAQANQFVLNSIKGLGANPSNADREFIEKTVPRLSTDPAALPQLLNFMERRARGQLTNYNTKIKGVQSQPMGQSIPMSLEVPEPEIPKPKAATAQQAMPTLPPATTANKGRVILDQQTGQRLRSNGMQWAPE